MTVTNLERFERFGPAWNARPVMVFAGQHDTHLKTGEDYETRPLGSLFTLEPSERPKGGGLAFVPSSYADYDGRNHAAQRERGSFVALTGDVDHGDHALERIETLVRAFAGDAAWLIYSSAHARPGDMRWRVILPLEEPLGYADWHDAQNAFFNFMEAAGIPMDRALDRAAQPVYLPNVPAHHGKSGEELRGFDDQPLYYRRSSTGTNAPGLKLDAGSLGAGIAAIRRQRAADEELRERIRQEAERKRGARRHTENTAVIDDFNKGTSVATMLELNGYKQSPRHAEDWRSPYQQGESYATRIIGDKWVSLSASDVSAGLGERFGSGCYGDAYDLFVHFDHKGDHKAAFRQIHAERKAAEGGSKPERPKAEQAKSGGDEYPGPDDSDEPEPDPDTPDILPVCHPANWQGQQSPVREWRWDSFIPNMQATLLTGAGAAGKSLATQQQCTCVAMGLPFLGVPTVRCPSLYITCEDDLDELHRRQEAICVSLGVSLESTRGHLFLLSLQGQIGNELAIFDADGKMSIAPRYSEIERTCLALGVKHVTIDNTAHTFAGNENDRHQVAAFVNLNNKLAQTIGGSVVMVGHPNKAGDSYSGSTAWENQVRSRLYLEIPKRDEGTPVDPDMRVLRNEKANYSQRGAEVHFYWLQGAFVTEDQMPQGSDRDVRDSAQAGYENALFLDLLDKLTEQRRNVSHAPNVGHFAPRIMAGMPEAKGLSKANLARAMERLFLLDQIVASQPLWKGSDRHPVFGLARKKAAGGAGGAGADHAKSL